MAICHPRSKIQQQECLSLWLKGPQDIDGKQCKLEGQLALSMHQTQQLLDQLLYRVVRTSPPQGCSLMMGATSSDIHLSHE